MMDTLSLFDTPCRTAGSIFQLVLLLSIACFMMACGVMVQKNIHTMPGWHASMKSLTSEITDALAANNRQRLEALHVTEQEYAAHVWPHLPVAQIPQWQNHRDFVWQQHLIRSMRGIDTILNRYGGKNLQITNVSFDEKPEVYGQCTVHPGAVTIVLDELGEERRIRIFGSLIEMNGFYKVFSYSID
ncbi:MAG: hypothetical protein N3B18_14075 [Desulfobacterota bacterium]|nr:hypothetical protein [Thermodesulfobacteriota bacterium]